MSDNAITNLDPTLRWRCRSGNYSSVRVLHDYRSRHTLPDKIVNFEENIILKFKCFRKKLYETKTELFHLSFP